MVYGWELEGRYCMPIELEIKNGYLEIPDAIAEFLLANEVLLMGDLMCHTEQSLSAIPGFQSEWLPVIVEELTRCGWRLGEITEYSRDPLGDFIRSQSDF